MANLLKMDLYRMRKAKSFWVCLILTFVFALISTPLAWLMFDLASLLGVQEELFPKTTELSKLITSQPGMLSSMLTLISICGFFYADIENGYVKNIAGQMTKRGFTVLSKFLASIPHTLLFLLTGVVGKLLGTVLFQRILVDGAVADSLRIFLLRLVLLESICAILLLFTAALQSKSLGTVFAVLFGTGLLSLAYAGIDAGLDRIFTKKDFDLGDYMPDQLLQDPKPDTLAALAVSAVVICVFLWCAIRIFDRKDVK